MKYISYFLEGVFELILILVHFPTYLLNEFFPLKRVSTTFSQKRPIVLVERWFRHNVFHIFAKWYLEKKGFQVFTINYSITHGGFNISAKHLARFIEKRNLENVVLVGISAGALTCMEYLQKMNGWGKTFCFISIGGTLNGAFFPKLFPISTSLRQMRPGSSFLKDLYEREIKHPDKIFCLSSKMDEMVGRKYSTFPETHCVQINVVGHNLLHTFWLPTYDKVTKIAMN